MIPSSFVVTSSDSSRVSNISFDGDWCHRLYHTPLFVYGRRQSGKPNRQEDLPEVVQSVFEYDWQRVQ